MGSPRYLSRVLLPGLALVVSAPMLVGCIDDSTPTPAASIPDSAVTVTPTATVDATPPPPPPDASVGAEGGMSATSTAAGGVVTKSENYKLVTRTGGSPGSGTPASSPSFKAKPTLPGSKP